MIASSMSQGLAAGECDSECMYCISRDIQSSGGVDTYILSCLI